MGLGSDTEFKSGWWFSWRLVCVNSDSFIDFSPSEVVEGPIGYVGHCVGEGCDGDVAE